MDERLARELGNDVGRFARDKARHPKSYGYRSYVRGHYAVLVQKHPELAEYKEAFMTAAGVITV